MFNILKKKAITFFDQNKEMDVAFKKCQDAKTKRNFFMFLIAHYSEQPEEIVNAINILKTNNLFSDQEFLNVVWSLSLQISCNKDILKKLSQIISLINSKSIIQKTVLLEFLPQSIIHQSGLMEQQQMDKKTQRIYTKINYQQHKYSLLKQNNQGFAKLLLLLINLTDSFQIEDTWTKILSLIGNFDLDPDRVLDLIIQTKLQKCEVQIYNHFIKKFKKQSITIVIGNKLTKRSAQLSKSLVFAGYVSNFSKISMEEIYKKDGQIINPSLIQLCANLIKQNIIKIEDLEIYLQPSDSIIQQINYKRIKNGQQKIMKSFKMNLEQIDEKQKIKLFFQDNIKFMGQLLHSSKLALYCQFLKQNDWKMFKKCWKTYEGKFDLLLYQPIMNNMLSLMEWIIQPIYQKISFSRFFKQKKPVKINFPHNQNGFHQHTQVGQQLFKDLKILFTYVQAYIGFNHSLFFKLCRIFKQLIKGNQVLEVKMSSDQLEQNLKFIIKNFLIPGISYDKNNPTIGMEAYQVLQKFDYKFRYQCYLQVYTSKMTLNPYLAKFFQHVKNKQNVIVNNLSKDNKKLFVKKLAKLTHNHALQVLYWIVRRLLMADYQAVVPQIVSALNNCTPLTLQMTMFLMIFYLNEQKQPSVNAKTRQFQPWFKNIITFISLFYRKYLQVDIQPVFDYIIVKVGQPIRQLEDNGEMPGALLKLLHQLLNKMFGTFMTQDINKKQFQILATGYRLQFQMLDLTSQIRAAKKSKHMLQKFFWTQSVDHHNGYSLAFNMLVLLTQKRAQLIHKSYIDDIKIIGDIFDEYTVLIIQLVRVLTYQSVDFQHYKQLLPNNALNILLNVYKLPMEIAFQVVRPGVKAVGLMTKQEWYQINEEISKVLDTYLMDRQNLIQGHIEDHQIVYQNLNLYKKNFKQVVSIGFFSTFWLLSLDSIHFPAKLYTQKIQDLRVLINDIQKKIEGIGSVKKDRNDRDVQKNKTLYQKILKEQQVQKKKALVTLTEQNLKKLQIEAYKTNSASIDAFAQVFVQTCLLPRLLLDPKQALYCIKFVIQTIKANKLSSSKSIKFLTLIIQFVSNYLPHSTFREATSCLSIFLSQILGIFINWNDVSKLKQDLKRYLGIQDIKDSNYTKLKEYILKLFQRVGKLVISIKDEPYMIKNCLYLLQKVDAIPGYKQQAQQLQEHLKQIKSKYQTQDMQTICDRQIAILSSKKQELPDKNSQNSFVINTQGTQQNNSVQIKNGQPNNFPKISPIKQMLKSQPKQFKKDKSPQPNRQNKDKQQNKRKQQKKVFNTIKDDKFQKKQVINEKQKQDNYQDNDKMKKSLDRNDKEKKIQQKKSNGFQNKNIDNSKAESKSSKMEQQISKLDNRQISKLDNRTQMIAELSAVTFSNLQTVQDTQKQKQAILPPLRTVKQMRQLQLKRKHSQIANKGQSQTNPDNNTKIIQQNNQSQALQLNKKQKELESNSLIKEKDKQKNFQEGKIQNKTQEVGKIMAQPLIITKENLPQQMIDQTKQSILKMSSQIKQIDKIQQNKDNYKNKDNQDKFQNNQQLPIEKEDNIIHQQISRNNEKEQIKQSEKLNNQKEQIILQKKEDQELVVNQKRIIHTIDRMQSKEVQKIKLNQETPLQRGQSRDKDQQKSNQIKEDKKTEKDKNNGSVSIKSQMQTNNKMIQNKEKNKNNQIKEKKPVQIIMKMNSDNSKERKSQMKESRQSNKKSQIKESRWGTNQANTQYNTQENLKHSEDYKDSKNRDYKEYKNYKTDRDKSPRNQDKSQHKQSRYNYKQEKNIHNQDKYRHNKQDKYPMKQEKYDNHKYQDRKSKQKEYRRSKERQKERKKSKDRDSRSRQQWKKDKSNYDKYDTDKPKDRQGRYEKSRRSRSRDKNSRR